MSRTTQLKLVWCLLVGVVLGAVVLWLVLARPALLTVVFVGVLFLVPGRVQGFLYRDLFTGRWLLDAGRNHEAIPYFKRFLDTLSRRPGLKHALWLSFSIYSTDAEVMTRNNLGAACLRLGELEAARTWLESAAQLDPLAPLVHYNLALLAAAESDPSTSEAHLQRSRELGLSGKWHDRFAAALQQILAAVEARRSTSG